eukprot:scaffold7684_cov119-Isochrysis_galbana.AAC.8
MRACEKVDPHPAPAAATVHRCRPVVHPGRPSRPPPAAAPLGVLAPASQAPHSEPAASQHRARSQLPPCPATEHSEPTASHAQSVWPHTLRCTHTPHRPDAPGTRRSGGSQRGTDRTAAGRSVPNAPTPPNNRPTGSNSPPAPCSRCRVGVLLAAWAHSVLVPRRQREPSRPPAVHAVCHCDGRDRAPGDDGHIDPGAARAARDGSERAGHKGRGAAEEGGAQVVGHAQAAGAGRHVLCVARAWGWGSALAEQRGDRPRLAVEGEGGWRERREEEKGVHAPSPASAGARLAGWRRGGGRRGRVVRLLVPRSHLADRKQGHRVKCAPRAEQGVRHA